MRIPKKVRHLLAIAVVITAPIASSALAETTLLTLTQAEALAVMNNPALAAAGKQAEAMAAIPAQAGSLPDPKISLKALNLPVDSFSATAENMTQMQIGFSQAIPFPGKLGLKAEAAEYMAAAALENRQEFRFVLLRNTRIHWWNIAYLDKALSIIRRNQQLLRNLVRISETKYKTGKGLQQDVLLAQLELSRLLQRELQLQGVRERESVTLNALLGRSSDTPFILPTQPKQDAVGVDGQALKQWARSHRPMLLAMDNR
ncbi:MAG: TolC family protein, partial [Mariprofundaceae bacterium]